MQNWVKSLSLFLSFFLFSHRGFANTNFPQNAYGNSGSVTFYEANKQLGADKVVIDKKLLPPKAWIYDFESQTLTDDHAIEIFYAFIVSKPPNKINFDIFLDAKNLTALNRTSVYVKAKKINEFKVVTDKIFFKTNFSAEVEILPSSPPKGWQFLVDKMGINVEAFAGFKLITNSYDTDYLTKTKTYFIFIEQDADNSLVLGYSLIHLRDSAFGASFFRSKVLQDVNAKTQFLITRFQEIIKNSKSK